jgi:hypothetical protein
MTRALVILVLVGGVAHAEDFAARGEELAKAGDYSRAIDAFKAADKQQPRARNACMIGLAYLRREMWPQAEIFLTTCRERASAADPVPDWYGDAETQLVQKLAAANVAAVTVVVEPDVATAQVTVSSFAPDEVFPPRTVHLAPGRHTFEIRAPGYEPETRTIDIAGRDARRVVVTLYREGQRPGPVHSRVPRFLVGGGLVLGAAATAYALLAIRPVYNELASTPNFDIYTRDVDTFRFRREVGYGLAGAAVLAVATGIVLHYTVYATVDRDGAAVGVAFAH